MNMISKLKDMARAVSRRGSDCSPPRAVSLLALVCAALVAFAASAATHQVSNEQQLRNLTENAQLSDGDTITVMNNFALTQTVSITNRVTLTSAPGATNTITRGISTNRTHISISSSVGLSNIIFDGGGTEPRWNRLFWVGTDGSLAMGAGATIRNCRGGGSAVDAVPIYLLGASARFSMSDGAVIENCSNPDASATYQMGGIIRTYGGGRITIAGGTIRNCWSANYGGAIAIGGGGSSQRLCFEMSGGTITNCWANGIGGGALYLDRSAGIAQIRGGRIVDCRASAGGGIFFSRGAGNSVIVGGEISSCTGGGVVLGENAGILSVGGDARIVDNEGGNIVYSDGYRIKLAGGLTGRAGVTCPAANAVEGAQFGTYTSGTGAENFFCDQDPTLCGAVSGDKLVWVKAPLRRVELDLDNDGNPDVIITTTDGMIEDNGDGSYDVTGPAEIELLDENGETISVIEVPEGTTVTVGPDGVTTVDEDETVTVVTDNGDGTTTETPVEGPATIGPDGTITPTPAGLDGEARITAWWTTNAQWRLTFTVPESGLTGNVARLTADKSFSVKFARELADINTAGVDAINHTYGYLDFTIDEAKTEGGSIVVTLTITDERISSGSRMFVKITDPKDR